MQSKRLTPSEALRREFDPSLAVLPGAPQEPQESTIKRRGFRIGDIGILLKPGILGEVNDSLNAYRLPNTPFWFKGLVNLRGNIIPVFDLFALINGESSRTRVWNLFLGSDVETGGLVIDELPVQISLQPGSDMRRLPPLPQALQAATDMAYVSDGQVWLELEPEKLFDQLGQLLA